MTETRNSRFLGTTMARVSVAVSLLRPVVELAHAEQLGPHDPSGDMFADASIAARVPEDAKHARKTLR